MNKFLKIEVKMYPTPIYNRCYICVVFFSGHSEVICDCEVLRCRCHPEQKLRYRESALSQTIDLETLSHWIYIIDEPEAEAKSQSKAQSPKKPQKGNRGIWPLG